MKMVWNRSSEVDLGVGGQCTNMLRAVEADATINHKSVSRQDAGHETILKTPHELSSMRLRFEMNKTLEGVPGPVYSELSSRLTRR